MIVLIIHANDDIIDGEYNRSTWILPRAGPAEFASCVATGQVVPIRTYEENRFAGVCFTKMYICKKNIFQNLNRNKNLWRKKEFGILNCSYHRFFKSSIRYPKRKIGIAIFKKCITTVNNNYILTKLKILNY